mgnify:CR=1 FL=1
MNYKQKHPETCLAKCLLILLDKQKKIKTANNKELEILNFSLKYDRENIARGHLEKVVKDFKVKIEWYVDTKIFYDFIKKRQVSKEVRLHLQKINLKLIDELLQNPLVLYIDQFYLWKKEMGLYYKYHYPHFILLLSKKNNKYEIIDPNTGKNIWIDQKILSKAIIGLRNHLWFSPQLIQIR